MLWGFVSVKAVGKLIAVVAVFMQGGIQEPSANNR
jgi:hypothetical protein